MTRKIEEKQTFFFVSFPLKYLSNAGRMKANDRLVIEILRFDTDGLMAGKVNSIESW